MPTKKELLITEKVSPGRWYLIKGQIKARSSLRVKVLFRNDNNSSEEILPVSCKGTILELVKVPPNTKKIFIEITSRDTGFEIIEKFSLKPVNFLNRVYRMFRRVIPFFQERFREKRELLGLSFYTLIFNLQKAYKLANKIRDCYSELDYTNWIEFFDTLRMEDIKDIRRDIKYSNLKTKFLILFIGNKDEKEVEKTINSLKAQLYQNFEIKFTHGIDKSQWKRLIESWKTDRSYIILLPPGTTLAIHGLYCIAKIAETSQADLIYTDHDYINSENVRINPCFKPDFSLEYLRSTNYIGEAFAIKVDSLLKIDTITEKDLMNYNSHSLLLKIIEKIEYSKIKHIPMIIFHFPEKLLNKKNDTSICENPVKEHLERLKIPATVQIIEPGKYKILYQLKKTLPVSIIIPNRDQPEILKRCIESIFRKTTYKEYEIILIDNQSTDKETIKYIESLLVEEPKVKVLKYNQPFNYSAMNNLAVKIAQGEVLVFLNNDTEVITPQWLEVMLGCLEQPNVGAVGVKLYYPDDTVQHAGVIIGPGGCADNIFKGLKKDEKGYMDRAILQQDLSAVTSACMMTWKELFLQVGGFDEVNLPISFNDVDYCLKLRERGYRIIFTPYVELYHNESVSRGKDYTPEGLSKARKEADYIRQKWKKYIEYDPFYNPNLNYKKPDFTLNEFPIIKKPWRQ
ncbi:MAG: glycosyltransferase family 2 protein [Caldimicrobium sp.]